MVSFDVLLVYYSEIFYLFICWIINWILHLVYLPDFLSRTICFVVNHCVVPRHPAKTEALRICCRGLRIGRGVTEWNATAAGGSAHIG